MLQIHDKQFEVRALARLPLRGAMLFLVVVFSFFGAMDGALSAFTALFDTHNIHSSPRVERQGTYGKQIHSSITYRS